jgi:hypothetical protein
MYRSLIEQYVAVYLDNPNYHPKHIVLVSHGDWIQQFMQYLGATLQFKPRCEIQYGYPKNTGIYGFQIVKKIAKGQPPEEYELFGIIHRMNCVSHWSGIQKKFSSSIVIHKRKASSNPVDERQRTLGW